MRKPRRAPVTEKIFDALCAHPYGLTNREIAAVVYDGPDGGPDWAAVCIGCLICAQNKRWIKNNQSLHIRGYGGPGSRYQVWIVRRRRDR